MTTRITKHEDTANGFTETESAPLSSVELSETAKGDIKVSSVKIYANDPDEAWRLAVRIMFETRAMIAAAQDTVLHAQLEASIGAAKAGKP